MCTKMNVLEILPRSFSRMVYGAFYQTKGKGKGILFSIFKHSEMTRTKPEQVHNGTSKTWLMMMMMIERFRLSISSLHTELYMANSINYYFVDYLIAFLTVTVAFIHFCNVGFSRWFP